MQSYFTKRRPILEIVCIAGWILCVPVVIFMPGGIPIGMPVAAVLAVIYIIYNGSKVKDSEVDVALENMIAACKLSLDPRTALGCYDLAVAPVVKGKDNKLRTSLYVVSVYEENTDGRTVTVYRFHLLDGTSERKRYTLPPDDCLTLTETSVMTPVGPRTRSALIHPLLDGDIPVTTADLESSRLVEGLCVPVA